MNITRNEVRMLFFLTISPLYNIIAKLSDGAEYTTCLIASIAFMAFAVREFIVSLKGEE